MPLVKISELEGAALDWAVEEAQGYGNRYLEFWNIGGDKRFIYCQVGHSPSTHWDQGGPIIEREKISIRQWTNVPVVHAYMPLDGAEWSEDGASPLIAAMRCYVASKLGESIEIPEELT